MEIKFKLLLVWGLAWGVATCHAQAERPITIVVPTAPGGGNDAMARTIG